MYPMPSTRKIPTTLSFTITIAVFRFADSSIPRTSTAVTTAMARNATKLKTPVTCGSALALTPAGSAERILQHQVPADDPGHKLTQRRIAIGIGRTRNRNQRRELRIAQTG